MTPTDSLCCHMVNVCALLHRQDKIDDFSSSMPHKLLEVIFRMCLNWAYELHHAN